MRKLVTEKHSSLFGLAVTDDDEKNWFYDIETRSDKLSITSLRLLVFSRVPDTMADSETSPANGVLKWVAEGNLTEGEASVLLTSLLWWLVL